MRLKWLYLLDTGIKISDKCCDRLKKDPMKSLNYEGRIVGSLAEEGMQRKAIYIKTGCNVFTEGGGGRSMPLGFWREQDILKYLYDHKIPIAGIYGEIRQKSTGEYYTTGAERTGCVGCGFGLQLDKEPNRYQNLYKTHPKLWNYYINTLGFGKVFDLMGIKYVPEPELLELD